MSAQELLTSFMDAEIGTEELNEEYFVCPELEDVPITVVDYDIRIGTYVDKATDEEKIWSNLILKFNVDSDEAREELKRDKVIVPGSPIFLRVNEETRQLDPDNNQPLAKLIKLFGLSMEAGATTQQLFESFKGCYCYGVIRQRDMINKDKEIVRDEEGNAKQVAEVVSYASEID